MKAAFYGRQFASSSLIADDPLPESLRQTCANQSVAQQLRVSQRHTHRGFRAVSFIGRSEPSRPPVGVLRMRLLSGQPSKASSRCSERVGSAPPSLGWWPSASLSMLRSRFGYRRTSGRELCSQLVVEGEQILVLRLCDDSFCRGSRQLAHEAMPQNESAMPTRYRPRMQQSGPARRRTHSGRWVPTYNQFPAA